MRTRTLPGSRRGCAGWAPSTSLFDGQTVVVNEVPADGCEQVLAIAADARSAQAQVLVRDFAPAA